jgi:cytochrome c oxidase cbb3-type subunit 3
MSDFVSEFWSWFIIVPTVLGLLYCVILLHRSNSATDQKQGDVKTMGHVWDGDLEELNNPLPKWWLQMFYITLIFSVVYLILYPGLGSFAGILNWTSTGRYEQEVKEAEASFAPMYASYLATPIDELKNNDKAMGTAKRLFANNCAVCHGADAGGYTGFPNLTDNDWIYGEEESTVKTTIVNGRKAAMPAWGAALGEKGVADVSEYVYSLTHDSTNKENLASGEQKYMTMCIACHGPEAKGNTALGAPNLSDQIWLYGGSLKSIADSVNNGRNGIMPAFGSKLTESQVHLITAYLNSLQKPDVTNN